MAKPYTFPTLYDELLYLSITKLKEWGYLKPNQKKWGNVTWSRNGKETASFAIFVNTQDEHPTIKFKYSYKGEPYNYSYYLTSIPSNLGKGRIWYFICPITNKRCRKLYLLNGRFAHREAFTGCLYEKQTQSKFYRYLDKTFGAYFKVDDLYEELHKKYFKRTYAGKPTKRYLEILKQIEKAESVPIEQFPL